MNSSSKLLVCEMSIQMCGRYGSIYLSLWGQDRRHDGGIPLERDLDYGDLRRAAARMANALAARGVLEGDRVALLPS